jgi:hypothetical protein
MHELDHVQEAFDMLRRGGPVRRILHAFTDGFGQALL